MLPPMRFASGFAGWQFFLRNCWSSAAIASLGMYLGWVHTKDGEDLRGFFRLVAVACLVVSFSLIPCCSYLALACFSSIL